MAMISEQNARCQAVILPASGFCFEIEAILASLRDLTHFVHCRVGKLRHRTTMPSACRLALNKMASNLECILDRFGPYLPGHRRQAFGFHPFGVIDGR